MILTKQIDAAMLTIPANAVDDVTSGTVSDVVNDCGDAIADVVNVAPNAVCAIQWRLRMDVYG